MPLLGKIVVIKRNGTDGTEFPLTASCLFGRKLDCDIRIQLPQVSKEHCRIEFNENKELILTNLSSVNPTRINGDILQQSGRLKHGDLITIIDRSFRFEYPPAPTPKKKRLSTPGKGETIKVLQDQQVKSTPGTTAKNKSEIATDTCLKDGFNLPICQDQSAADQENKASMDSISSPFSDLYNMVKRDLATKPVWKPASLSNTPCSKPSVDKQGVENVKPVTPKSTQKKRRSSATKPLDGGQTENLTPVKTATPAVQGEQKRRSKDVNTPLLQKKTPQTTPQKFTVDQVQIAFESPGTKSPKSRRSSISQTPEKQTTPQNPSESAEAEEPKAKQATRTSPRASLGKRFQVQDVLQEVAATPTSDDTGKSQPSSKKHKCDDLPLPVPKRKRVSFGGQLDPELFDKRLPPNSPLRRGATPGRCSLGFTQKSLFRLRRASTIGLMGYQLEEDITENPAKNVSPKRVASPAKARKTPSPAKAPKTPSPAKAPKTPSPAKAPKTPSPAKAPKTPSPAKAPKTPSSSKQSSSPKAKTPSPKNSKSSTPSNQATPKSSKRLSNASVKLPSQSEESLLKTPMTHGRFSVSRISTPSPVSDFEKEVKEDSTPAVEKPQECVIPRATPRRSSMKASARKTPKSLLKSALKVVRSRRSGATRANLKVVSSWADIVRFGQAKPQMECGANKTANKKTAVKQTKVTKPKTPARKLKDHTSTGHADSPASIVIGKAHLRSTRPVCAAPKLVCNVALFKMGMKMDDDLSGVSDIFKTPANSRCKSDECPTLLGVGEMTETSVINTPEEAGEMVVSPMSVASTAKLGRYNSEAVTRLLQDNQDESLIEEMDESIGVSSSELCTVMSSESHAKNKKAVPVQTPQHKPTPPECLTGVKRLMRTPRQKSNPIEDLRGKLLQTPKEPKLPQEESLEGVAELFNTPKQKKTPSKKEPSRLMNTPKVKNSPVLCAVALRRLSQTPNDITEQQEDLTGVKRLMRTPRQKKQPVEEDLTGVQQMMKTPKLKKQPVEEDLTGVQQMMKTPKQKNQPVEDLVGVKTLLQTPKEKSEPVENDFGIDNLMMTPKQKSDEEPDSVGPTVLPVEDPSVESEERENICPAEDVKNDTEEAVCLQVETKEAGHPEEFISHELMTNVDKDVQKAPLEMICTFDVISTTGETTPSVSSLTQEEQSNRYSPAIKSRRGAKVRFAQKSQTSQEHHVASDSRAAKVAGTDEETSADSAKSVPSVRGRRGKPAIELSEDVVVQSPARKSNRGRNPKELVEAPKSCLASTEDERVTLKPRRGRKAEQEIEEPVADPKASAEVKVPMKSPAPVRVKRGRKGKYELANSQEPEASVDGVEVASESAELQPSAETETPVKTNTRARRGRTTKKEKVEEILDIRSPDAVVEVVESAAENEASLKSTTKRGRSTRKEMLKTSQVEESSKPNPIDNTDFTTSDSKTLKSTEAQSAVETEDLVEVNVKPRRGRAIKKAIPVTAQVAETSKPTSDSTVLPEENPEMPLVKPSRGRRINPLALKNKAVVDEATVEALAVRCGRGARNKELKAQVVDAVNGQGTETVTTAALTKESVKKVRGSQKTKKLNAQVLDDRQEEDQDKPGANSDSVPQMKAPAARSARGKRAVAVLAEPEAPVKRGRRAATVEIPPPIVKSSRGRKAAAKSEPEKVSTEVVEPIEVTSNETKVLESVRVKTPLAQADSEMVVKRGRITKKSKVTTKDISVSEVEDPQHNKKDEPAAKDDPTVGDIKQSAHPSVQKRKGRAAKKQEEPETDNPAAEENIQPVRRGRAATSVVSQLDVGTKRGQKRKNVKVVAEEIPDTESLTKRKRGKGASAETQPDVAVSFKRQKIAVKEPEETSIVGAEEDSKKEEKLVRGRRKPAQEDVSVPAEDPRLEVSTRRGTRGQKKAEADVPSAPARRTRRK